MDQKGKGKRVKASKNMQLTNAWPWGTAVALVTAAGMLTAIALAPALAWETASHLVTAVGLVAARGLVTAAAASRRTHVAAPQTMCSPSLLLISVSSG